MKRLDFIAATGGAFVLAVSPMPKIVTGEPLYMPLVRNLEAAWKSITDNRPDLVFPAGESVETVGYAKAVVKWDRWKEWTDPVTGDKNYRYSVRLTGIPEKLIPPGGIVFDNQRAFHTICPTESDGTERTPWTFVFTTFAVHGLDYDAVMAAIRLGDFHLVS